MRDADTRYSTNQPTNQPTYQPTNQSINQPTNQPTNQSTIQPTNQSINQPTNQPTNQPINQPTNQPTQPTNQRNQLLGPKRWTTATGATGFTYRFGEDEASMINHDQLSTAFLCFVPGGNMLISCRNLMKSLFWRSGSFIPNSHCACLKTLEASPASLLILLTTVFVLKHVGTLNGFSRVL